MTINNLNEHISTSGKGLYGKTARSGIWVFAIRIIERVFSLIRLVILARILAPQDFGLMGVALLTMAILETFSQTGFQTALIQKKNDIVPYLNVTWTVLVLRGFLLFTLLYLIAPHTAIFFKSPEAKSVIRIIAFSILLHAISNIGVIYFQKELEFNKQFLYQISGVLADFIVAISLALVIRSVWALVFGLLAGNGTRCIVSYLIHPFRPRFYLDLLKAKELFGFGKWILGSSILVFLVTQGDDIFVGKLLGLAMLGFYQIAYRISNMPATEIANVISRVTFPAYSKIQDNLPKLREAYLKVLQLTAFISIPLTGGIFILASEFTKLFLGDKWMPIVPAMQVLVFAALVRGISATTSPIFRAVGKPQIDTKWQIVRLFVLAIFIYPFTIRWGIFGSSMAVLLSILVAGVGFSFMVIKITKCVIKTFIKIIFLPLISGTGMVLLISVLKNAINIIKIGDFLLFVLAGILVYLSISYILDRVLNYGIQPLIMESFRVLK